MAPGEQCGYLNFTTKVAVTGMTVVRFTDVAVRPNGFALNRIGDIWTVAKIPQ